MAAWHKIRSWWHLTSPPGLRKRELVINSHRHAACWGPSSALKRCPQSWNTVVTVALMSFATSGEKKKRVGVVVLISAYIIFSVHSLLSQGWLCPLGHQKDGALVGTNLQSAALGLDLGWAWICAWARSVKGKALPPSAPHRWWKGGQSRGRCWGSFKRPEERQEQSWACHALLGAGSTVKPCSSWSPP